MRAAHLDVTGERYGLPTYPFRMAPDGLFTRGQLREMGLRPTGEPVAQLMWCPTRRHRPVGSDVRTAALYRLTETLLRDTPSPARLAGLQRARAARRVCPTCQADAGYVIPAQLGECLDCNDIRAAA